MTVMTARQMTRNSYTAIYNVTSSAAGASTALTDVRSGGQPVFRASLGGTTITSSSEATIAVPVCDHIGFIVSYAGSSGSTSVKTLTINKGDAWRGSQGNVTIAMNSSDATCANFTRWLAGPFETARFALTATTSTDYGKRNSNYVKIGFATAGAATGNEQQYVNVLAFKWPGVSYDT